MAFPPSALPEYLEGRTPKEKRSMHFCLAGGGMRFEKGKGVFLSGLPPYSAACGGGSHWHGIGAYERISGLHALRACEVGSRIG